MHVLRSLFILVFSLMFTTFAQADTGLDELLDRHIHAIGGANALAAVKTLQMDLRITEGASVLTGNYATDRQGRMRIDIFAGDKAVWTEALDGDSAWCQQGAAAKPVTEAAEAAIALKHGVLLPGKILSLREVTAHGVKLSIHGRERLDGISYYVLRLDFPDGFSNYLYVHPDSYLIERQRDFRAMHPDLSLKKKRLETRFGDYRPTGGVLRSYSEQTYNLDTGQLEQSMIVIAIRINQPLAANFFSMPR